MNTKLGVLIAAVIIAAASLVVNPLHQVYAGFFDDVLSRSSKAPIATSAM
ncbi:MAG: hypothetical protein ACJ71H_05655 [Nitrososphaeraceae archaeon]